jgi:hypothetical protein
MSFSPCVRTNGFSSSEDQAVGAGLQTREVLRVLVRTGIRSGILLAIHPVQDWEDKPMPMKFERCYHIS